MVDNPMIVTVESFQPDPLVEEMVQVVPEADRQAYRQLVVVNEIIRRHREHPDHEEDTEALRDLHEQAKHNLYTFHAGQSQSDGQCRPNEIA